jgi:hypothetical protein
MPIHISRRYDGHIILVEARRAPDGAFYKSFSIHTLGRLGEIVHTVGPKDDVTFDTVEIATASAVAEARAWIDDRRYGDAGKI